MTQAPYQVRAGDDEGAINAVNQWMRAQPWYTQALHQIGATPGQAIHLNGSQRDQLMRAAQANGMQIDMGDVEVDPGGNFNPKGHKLRNTLIVAGIAAGALTGGAALAAYGGAAGAGGAGAAGLGGVGLGETAATVGLGGLGAGGAGAFGAGSLGSMLATQGVSTGTGMLGNYMQNRSNRSAAQLQMDAANRAAELEAKSAADILAFQKEQEATRHTEWQTAQDKNAQLEADRLARQEPFRRTGVNSLRQLLNPIAYRSPGSIGGMLGR